MTFLILPLAPGRLLVFGVTCLCLIEAVVVAFLRHQLVVAADFDDLAAIQDDKAVGVAQGGQAVGNGDGGAAALRWLMSAKPPVPMTSLTICRVVLP